MFFKELGQIREMTGLLTPEGQAAEDVQLTSYREAQGQDGNLMSTKNSLPQTLSPSLAVVYM